MIKYLLKRKLEKMFDITVSIHGKTLTVTPTGDTTHLNRDMLKSMIMLECDYEVKVK